MEERAAPSGVDELPDTLPIFPLSGVLLLPGGHLPLNIFEPRYLAMTEDALAGDRLIGIVQPRAPTAAGTSPAHPAPVYPTGCAGRIVAASATPDGRRLITLAGVARFAIGAEIAAVRGYRRVAADWRRFAGDLVPGGGPAIDRGRLLGGLRGFLALHGIAVDWQAIDATPDERLVTSLAMICPFAPSEKQALLEAPDLAERSRIMAALIEMAVQAGSGGPAARH